MSISIEALAMAAADYTKYNLNLNELELPPPHLVPENDDHEEQGEEEKTSSPFELSISQAKTTSKGKIDSYIHIRSLE
ncbi:hypothetical protein ACS0TY_029378 [Phlomoides rotata]